MAYTEIIKLKLVNDKDIYVKDGGEQYHTDLHLVRNDVNMNILPIIGVVAIPMEDGREIIRGSDPDFSANFTIDVTTNIKPGKLADVGIEIMQSSAGYFIKALPQPSVENPNYTRLNAFQITVTVTLIGGNSMTATIRCCVHAGISSWWYTPSTVTIRPEWTFTPKFSIFADFGGIVCDITELNGVDIEANPIDVDGVTKPVVKISEYYAGSFEALDDIGFSTFPGVTYNNAVKITMPAHLGGGTKLAPIRYCSWGNDAANRLQVKLRRGPGTESMMDVTNLLIVSEGFDNESDFDKYVDETLVELETKEHLSPYNLIIPYINVFSLFMKTHAKGSTLASPYFVENYPTGSTPVEAYNLFHFFDLVRDPAMQEWKTLVKLIKLLGYPSTALQSQLSTTSGVNTYWTYLNTNYNLGSDITMSEFKDYAKTYAKLKMILPNESDSPLGIKTGQKPYYDNEHNLNYKELGAYYRRSSMSLMNDLFRTLHYGDQLLPEVFAIGNAGIRGKDSYNVLILCNNPGLGGINIETRYAGSRYKRIFQNLGDTGTKSFKIKSAVDGYDVVSPVPSASNAGLNKGMYSYMNVVAHELAHSFDIGDEYSNGGPYQTDGIILRDNNLQEYDTMSSIVSGANKLDGLKIKWNRPVYAGAARVKVKSISGSLTLEVMDGEEEHFATGMTVQVVNLNPQEIMNSKDDSLFTNFLTITSVTGKDIQCPLPTSGLTGLTVAESYTILELGKGFDGNILYFLAPATKKVMEDKNSSLTYLPSSPLSNFLDIVNHDHMQDFNVQKPKYFPSKYNNKIDFGNGEPKQKAKEKLKNDSNVVGLYVGGATYKNGMYHSTGRCMMIIETEEEGKVALPLCIVCGYQVILSANYKKLRDYYSAAVDRYALKYMNFLTP